MASEYLKWLARNEKPAEKRELTPREKRKNWWDYHKWHVVFATCLLLCAVGIIWNAVISNRGGPDYEIAYISSRRLPDETVEALQRALEEYGVDLTGDKQVKIQVNQYTFPDDYAEEMKLFADLTAGNNFIFLMDDTARVQKRYGVLAYSNGTYPAEGETPAEPLWYAWDECDVLANLDLGTYTNTYALAEDFAESKGNNQDLFSGLCVGRRGVSQNDSEERISEYTRFWDVLTRQNGHEEK